MLESKSEELASKPRRRIFVGMESNWVLAGAFQIVTHYLNLPSLTDVWFLASFSGQNDRFGITRANSAGSKAILLYRKGT